ncbi:hypothetical protein HZA98_01740 [Candidatus Woesearchaeota archaeon]|nr:hypothetical protein [Candidatus Woesearchaeota archaeon]
MDLQLFTKWYVRYVLLALCTVLLLVVPLLKGPLIGTEPFFYSRIASLHSLYDPLSFGGRFAAYPWGTGLVLSATPSVLLVVLPFLLGILSVLLVERILKHFSKDATFIYLSLLLFILSPSFIYLFSFTNSLFIAFFLSLAGFYLFIEKKFKFWVIPIVLVLPLFNLIVTGLFLLLLCFYSFFVRKDRKKLFFILLLFSILVTGLYYGYIFYKAGLPQQIDLVQGGNFHLLGSLFYDLGSAYGLSIFISLLGALGILLFWGEKYEHLFIFFSVLLFLTLAFFIPESSLVLNLFLIILAAKGFIFLAERKWTHEYYHYFILLVILSGFVFSAISQMNTILNTEPNEAELEAIAFLAEQESGVVFSDYSKGSWITSSGHENVMDENYVFAPDSKERLRDSQELFASRDLNRTSELFAKYDIRYVWIDSSMKNKLWDYDTDGLLFILQYTKSFNRIYDKDGVEIWKVSA